MASTATVLGQNVASIVSGSGLLQVQKKFERLPLDDAPLVGLIGYGPAVKYGSDFKFQWIKDKALSTRLTNTANIVTADTSVTLSTTDAASLQVGSMLLIDSELMLVTAAATSTTVAVTKGYSGSTSTTHTTSSTVYVLSPAMIDGASFTESPTILGEFEYNYPQLIPYEYSETGFRAGMVNYLTGSQNELDFHTSEEKHMKLATRHLEATLLYSLRQAPTSTLAGTLGGLFQYITTNATTVSGLLTATNLEDTMDLIYAFDNKRQSLTALMTRQTARIFSAIMRQYFEAEAEVGHNSVGVEVVTYRSALGTLNVTICQAMPNSKILLLDLNTDDIKIHPIDLDNFGTGWTQFTREQEHTNAVKKQKGFYGAFTLRVQDERRHAVISGFTTTVGSYAGAV